MEVAKEVWNAAVLFMSKGRCEVRCGDVDVDVEGGGGGGGIVSLELVG